MARRKTIQQLSDQFDRLQSNIYRGGDVNYTSRRWKKVESAANRYANNIRNSRYANSTGGIPRKVYMGLNAG